MKSPSVLKKIGQRSVCRKIKSQLFGFLWLLSLRSWIRTSRRPVKLTRQKTNNSLPSSSFLIFAVLHA